MQKVRVSVIMGVYNQKNKDILKAAVDSILSQTFKDFEFIIYNDGSDEDVTANLEEIAALDERIILISAKDNNGLAFSLNVCIDRACGEFIARMDADDKSLPTRFEKQIEFLENNEEYWWCGTNAQLFDEDGNWGVRYMPEIPAEQDYLAFSPYIHPSVMYRAKVFEVAKEKYNVSAETLRCEDYEIFMRLRQLGFCGYNIQEELFMYREGKDAYKKRKFKYRLNEARIRYRNFKSMKLLWPKGWIYVVRPIVGWFIPTSMLAAIKRRKYKR